MTATVERTPDPTTRIERLNRASARLIDPDADLPGAVGEGQLLPDELLSIHQLPEFQDLTPEQKATLSREEIASIVDAGIAPLATAATTAAIMAAGSVPAPWTIRIIVLPAASACTAFAPASRYCGSPVSCSIRMSSVMVTPWKPRSSARMRCQAGESDAGRASTPL